MCVKEKRKVQGHLLNSKVSMERNPNRYDMVEKQSVVTHRACRQCIAIHTHSYGQNRAFEQLKTN